jgi:hypothetical protein
MVLQRAKYNARIKYSAFRFRCQKSPLRIKIQRWFFHMMYMNASPAGLTKKHWKISFLFWLVSVCLIGYSHVFAGGAWRRRRTTLADFEYEIWKVFGTPIHGKSLRCLRWWITWKLTEQKKNLKKLHFRGGGGGFYAVVETYYLYRYFKYF